MTHTFNLDKGSVRLIVSHNGKKYRMSARVSVDPKLWNQKAKTLYARCKDSRVYEKLRVIDLRLSEKLYEKEEGGWSTESIRRVMEWAVSGETVSVLDPARPVRPKFWAYFREWGERDSPVKRHRRLVVNVVSRLMGERDDWEAIDSAWYCDLCDRMDAEGYSVNYKGTIIAKVKTVMNEGYKRKFHTNTAFRDFKKMSEETEAIALSEEELNALWDYHSRFSIKRKARDLFLIGVYSVARFSDYSGLSLQNIDGGMLRYVQHKTGHSVVLPASPRLVECMERNGGKAPSLSQQQLNTNIKEICREIGMTAKVHLSRSHGARRVSETKERWEMVSSHTARRTGATRLYLSGVPIKQCMLISGHTTEAVFLSYVRVTKEENARKLASLGFFGGKG